MSIAYMQSLSYKVYREKEVSLINDLRTKLLAADKFPELLKENLNSFISKRDKATKGQFCLACDNELTDCKCNSHDK